MEYYLKIDKRHMLIYSEEVHVLTYLIPEIKIWNKPSYFIPWALCNIKACPSLIKKLWAFIEILLSQQTMGIINLRFLLISQCFIFISARTHAICNQQHMIQTKTFGISTWGSGKLSTRFLKQDGVCLI